FRQAMEHTEQPLPGRLYSCVGAQPFAVSREHSCFVQERGGRVWWRGGSADPSLEFAFTEETDRLTAEGCRILLTVDADAFAADVPGVSAPNPAGFRGDEIAFAAYSAGALPEVASMELVEINPLQDVDGRSARWAAMAVWHFLMGLAHRARWCQTA